LLVSLIVVPTVNRRIPGSVEREPSVAVVELLAGAVGQVGAGVPEGRVVASVGDEGNGEAEERSNLEMRMLRTNEESQWEGIEDESEGNETYGDVGPVVAVLDKKNRLRVEGGGSRL
jgi:hypothetical protein